MSYVLILAQPVRSVNDNNEQALIWQSLLLGYTRSQRHVWPNFLSFGGENVADYAFRPLDDRQKIEKLWEDGRMPKEISEAAGVSIHVVYNELTRGQDGTRLPDQRPRYSADVAQCWVQASLERRGKRTRQTVNMGATAGGGTASR